MALYPPVDPTSQSARASAHSPMRALSSFLCLGMLLVVTGGLVFHVGERLAPDGGLLAWLVFTGLTSVVLGALLQRRSADASCWGELGRMALLAFAALFMVQPFLTANFVGGQDARWYLYVLTDAVEQARAGVFPVMVGQGQYQFNGAVHPFRFAPMYQQLGIVLDLLTFRSLPLVALQHGIVVVAAVTGAFGCYVGLTYFNPQRRWMACFVSLLYLASPTAYALLCVHDMYMSFLAAAWVPWAFHFAHRASREKSVLCAATWAGALSLVLMSHPPVGLWTAIATFAWVSFSVLAAGAVGIGAAVLGCAVCALGLLNAFHFRGIAELAPVSQRAFNLRDVTVVLLAALLAGAVYWLALRRIGRKTGDDATERRGNALLLGLAMGVAAFVALHLAFRTEPGPVARDTMVFVERFSRALLSPVSASGTEITDAKPGLGLLLGGLIALILVARVPDPRVKGVTAVAAFLLLCLYPITPFARAFWETVPTALIASTSGVVNLRITPVLATALAFASFGALAWWSDQRKWYRAVGLIVCAVLVAVMAHQTRRILRFSTALTHSGAQTDLLMRPENAALFIYSGNFIGLPPYFSHGVRDYRLESRLLDPVSQEQVTPTVLPRVTATRSAGLRVSASVAGEWLQLEPDIVLPGGSSLLLNFEFDQKTPAGVLVFESTYLYREYQLPESGYPQGFGAAVGNSRSLALWSSASVDQSVKMRFRPTDPAAWKPGEIFAHVNWGAFELRDLSVRTVSLVPAYRAQTDVQSAAWLETPRTWVPGYKAWRNGRPVDPIQSKNNLVAVPLEAGHNSIVVRFVGSQALQLCFAVSVAAWIALICGWITHARTSAVATP
jgi:hypothetical protein